MKRRASSSSVLGRLGIACIVAPILFTAGLSVAGCARQQTAKPTQTPVESTRTVESSESVIPSGTATVSPEFPAQGSDARKELMDAVRTYLGNPDLVFVVHAAVVQGDVALVDVEPTKATDDGSLEGRVWIFIRRPAGGKWAMVNRIPPDTDAVGSVHGEWPDLPQELVDAFASRAGGWGSQTQAKKSWTGDPGIGELSASDLKPGLVFTYTPKSVTSIVRPSGTDGSQLVGAVGRLSDDSAVWINSDEVVADQLQAGDSVSLRIVRVEPTGGGIPQITTTVEWVTR